MPLVFQITNAGRAALVNAQNNGTNAVTVAGCGLSGQAVVASAAATNLPGEFKRIATLSGAAVAPDVIHVVVRDESGDAYTARSLALYLGDGTLFGLYGQADPILNKAAAALGLLAVDLTLADIAAVQIAFGNANFLNPPATAVTPGVVELADDAEALAMVDAMRALTPRGMGLALTAARILTRLMTVDGAGSGLDADLLDGRQAAEFALLTGATFTGPIFGTGIGLSGGITAPDGFHVDDGFYLQRSANVLTDLSFDGGDVLRFNRAANRYEIIIAAAPRLTIDPNGVYVATRLARDGNIVWDAGNDGAGSGLDADLLDGRHGAEFALLTGATFSGSIFGTGIGLTGGITAPDGFRVDDSFYLARSANVLTDLSFDDGDVLRFNRASNRYEVIIAASPRLTIDANGTYVATRLARDGNIVWDAGNDGAGSGLDADLIDGWERDAVRDWNNLLNRPGQFPPAAHSHGAADIAGAFADAVLGANGYQVLPNGLILQWVAGVQDAPPQDVAQFVAFPISFPTAALRAFVSTGLAYSSDRGDAFYQLVGEPAVNGCTVVRQHVGAGNDAVATWPIVFAIGY